MKHFINGNDQVFAFNDDGSQDSLIGGDLKPITEYELEILRKPTVDELDFQAKEKIKNDLMVLDQQTIRAMREYIASKADAPQILKDREALAAQLRAKLK